MFIIWMTYLLWIKKINDESYKTCELIKILIRVVASKNFFEYFITMYSHVLISKNLALFFTLLKFPQKESLIHTIKINTNKTIQDAQF